VRKRRAEKNAAHVRQMLQEKDPGFRSRLEAAVRQVDSELQGAHECADSVSGQEQRSESAAEHAYVIVIGTGPIGQTVAERARPAGLSVAAMERELVTVTGVHWAPGDGPVTLTLAEGRHGGGR
jgi:lactate dehydrogenase-like 2-hydroxyacid dehydrogenase